MIRKLLITAFTSMAFLASPAHAADLAPAKPSLIKVAPPLPTYSWTGFYLGVNAGYGAENTTASSGSSGGDIFGDALAGLIPSNLANAPQGALIGGQFGYRHQINWLVVGVEETIDWAHIANQSSSGSNIGIANVGGASTVSQNVDWLSFSNAVVGLVPSPHFMTFFTGGLAIGGVQTGASSAVTVGGTSLSGSQTLDQLRVGWDVGLGVEFAINSNWTLRADAKYYDLGNPAGSFQTNGVGGVNPLTIDFSQPARGYIGTAGINYRF